ncbi:MAG: bestrophin family ion channel [Burkholderiales bacterium]|nr:bestrophin family ion channel [Burkholderiales bacterium]
MIVKSRLSLRQVFAMTWRVDILMLAFCVLIYYVDAYVFVKFTMPIGYPAFMGTAIAFFIGFNNDQAYNRWWEARIIWGGLVNDSRTWARNLLAYSDNNELNHRMVRRHLAFLYATVSSLRKDGSRVYLKYVDDADVVKIKDSEHIPNKLLQFQAEDLAFLHRSGALNDFSFNSLNLILQNFCDGMGKSERINNTVFPITYVFFTRLFIWIFIALITSSLIELVGIHSVLLGWFAGFVFNVIHLNGQELVNPFVISKMTVPIASISRNIEINLLHMLNDPNVPKPLPLIEDAYSV